MAALKPRVSFGGRRSKWETRGPVSQRVNTNTANNAIVGTRFSIQYFQAGLGCSVKQQTYDYLSIFEFLLSPMYIEERQYFGIKSPPWPRSDV
jgi:hypothetical protein